MKPILQTVTVIIHFKLLGYCDTTIVVHSLCMHVNLLCVWEIMTTELCTRTVEVKVMKETQEIMALRMWSMVFVKKR